MDKIINNNNSNVQETVLTDDYEHRKSSCIRACHFSLNGWAIFRTILTAKYLKLQFTQYTVNKPTNIYCNR